MESKQTNRKSWVLALLSGLSVILLGRWMPHPPNFTPMIGALLFCAAFFSRHHLHFVVPIAGLWLSDLFLNNVVYSAYFEGFVWFGQSFIWCAIAYGIIALLAQRQTGSLQLGKLFGMTIGASVLFFLISNLGAWIGSPALYSRDLTGLSAAMIAGLPFAVNSIAGDLFYTVGFFGIYYIVNRSHFQRILAA